MPSIWINNDRPAGLPPDFVLVVGTRTFDDYPLLARKLDRLTFWMDNVHLIVGDGYSRVYDQKPWRLVGADWHALRWAENNWYVQHIYQADWSKGRSAGPRRNSEMVRFAAESGCELMVAFWDGKSPGTEDCIEKARRWLPDNSIKIVRY